ncbi:MAG: hypothetical protein ACR2PS_06535 [Pseudomonadales bacterium]
MRKIDPTLLVVGVMCIPVLIAVGILLFLFFEINWISIIIALLLVPVIGFIIVATEVGSYSAWGPEKWPKKKKKSDDQNDIR